MTKLWEMETSDDAGTDAAFACSRVLIVGEDAESRNEVEGFLRRERIGIAVQHAPGAAEAARAVTADRPGCVLIDPASSHERALVFLTRIRDVDAAVPVVVLSPHDDDELTLALLAAGADDHLFTRRSGTAQLWSIVRRAVARRYGLAQHGPPARSARESSPQRPTAEPADPDLSPAESGASATTAAPPAPGDASDAPRSTRPDDEVPAPDDEAAAEGRETRSSNGPSPTDPIAVIETALSRSTEGLDAVVVMAIEVRAAEPRAQGRAGHGNHADGPAERIVEAINGVAEAVIDESGHVVLVVEHISSVDQAFAIAEGVRHVLADPEEAPSEDDVHQGIAVGTNPAETAESLLARARKALQHAIDRHLPYELDDPVSVRLLTQRAAIRNELRDAIANGDLVLDYQPIFDLRSGVVKGLEALARWRHPERGKLSPEAIFPMATRSVVLSELTQHIVQLACATTAEWNAGRSEALFVSVNVDIEELEHPTVLASIGSALTRTGLPADRLWLEIPGDARLGVGLQSRLNELHELGVHLAVDGLGPAFANSDRLAELPFSVAKLELTSGAALGTPGEARSTIESTVAAARNGGLVTVACGIETAEQRDGAVAVGCELGQGFGLGVPMSYTETANLLSGASVAAPDADDRGGSFR